MGDVVVHYKLQKSIFTIKSYQDYVDIQNDVVAHTYMLKKPKNVSWVLKSSEQTTNNEKYLEYYSDLTKNVSEKRFTLVIEEYDDKISFKLYYFYKTRGVGKRYFRTRKQLDYITYNFKTKNIYRGTKRNSNKKLISNKIRVNDFRHNSLPILTIKDIVLEINEICDWKEYTDFWGIYGDIENKLKELIMKRAGVNLDENTTLIEEFYYSVFLKHNGIKIPNHYLKFIDVKIPKKILKQNGNLVNSYMVSNNIRSSKIKRILNESKKVDFFYLKLLYDLLGVDYFNQLNDKVLMDNLTLGLWEKHSEYSNEEKKHIVIALNCGILLHTIIEHFKFKTKLSKYGLNVKERFTDKKSFQNEHYEWSNLVSSYKNGDIDRRYGDNVIDLIENEIYGHIGVDYYPVVLTDSNDYNEESAIQKNCVRTYIDKPNSIIISLRIGSNCGKDRATIEYRFRRNAMVRTQSLGRFNQNLNNTWDSILEILDRRVDELYKKKKLKLPVLVKTYPNKEELTKTAIFLEDPTAIYPVWDNGDGDDIDDDIIIENIFDDFNNLF